MAETYSFIDRIADVGREWLAMLKRLPVSLITILAVLTG
jgi:hypothetical protein